jgi:hypothetical protein
VFFFQDEEDLDENELCPLIDAFDKIKYPTRMLSRHIAQADIVAANWTPI